MSSATNEVIKTSLDRKVDLRTAAYINALSRIDEFYAVSGIFWHLLCVPTIYSYLFYPFANDIIYVCEI